MLMYELQLCIALHSLRLDDDMLKAGVKDTKGGILGLVLRFSSTRVAKQGRVLFVAGGGDDDTLMLMSNNVTDAGWKVNASPWPETRRDDAFTASAGAFDRSLLSRGSSMPL